jgi:hypothetical protein
MKRFAFGVLAGMAIMYFCDPEHGAERRRRAAAWWERNRQDVRATFQDVVATSRQAATAGQRLGQGVVHQTSAAKTKVRDTLRR